VGKGGGAVKEILGCCEGEALLGGEEGVKGRGWGGEEQSFF
jgi:hypothetical protein